MVSTLFSPNNGDVTVSSVSQYHRDDVVFFFFPLSPKSELREMGTTVTVRPCVAHHPLHTRVYRFSRMCSRVMVADAASGERQQRDKVSEIAYESVSFFKI